MALPDLRGGGAEKVAISLACQFVACGLGVDFVLMRAEGELLAEVPQGVRVIDLAAPRTRNVPKAFAQYLRRENPDAVIANMWPLTTACILASRLVRSKARIATCDHAVLSKQYARLSRFHDGFLGLSLAASYRFADLRIAVSGGVADDLAALSGIARKRFEVVYNPVPSPTVPDAKMKEQAERQWPGNDQPRILAVGSLKPEKNYKLLLRAFARVGRQSNARLIILGDGPLRGELEAQLQAEGLAERVLMPGFVADPARFYHSADLFVLSSDHEGFGNVIVEALACGLPVVASDCPFGPAEILENGRYGTLVPVGDARALGEAMLAALNAKHDRKALIRRAAEFAPDIAAQKYLKLLCGDGEVIAHEPT